MKELSALCRKLNYSFNNQKLLEEALTHRSVNSVNNERLEFLGDSLLNFIIAGELFLRHSSATEGELSRQRANLVKGETLADLAQEFNLGEYLRLGIGELKSGGFNRKSILANALEAIIGAIYLDSNIEQCQECVVSWYATRLERYSSIGSLKDAKTRLQEYLQAQKLSLPEYEILETEGDAHEQIFHVKCTVHGLSHTTQGSGTTRRSAEQEAAEKFLEILGIM